MNDRIDRPGHRDADGLRLLGLSRIPRCTACARLTALKDAYERRSRAVNPLPPVPPECSYQACAPLVFRYVSGSPG